MILPSAQWSFLGDAVSGVQATPESDIVAGLLILVLGMALGILLTCLLVLLHFLRRQPHSAPKAAPAPDAGRERRALSAIYGSPDRWLAIRCNNVALVQQALRLNNVTPCSWEDGLSAVQEKKLFISPPIGGWILAIGAHLPEAADDVDACFHLLTELSRKLGPVQYFSVNRALNHHAWAQADEGQIVRAYAWAGSTHWNQGEPTKAEVSLGLTCFDYGCPPDRSDFDRTDPLTVNTERVALLAARWSIDPGAVDARMIKTNQGVAGQFSRSRVH